MGRRRFLTLPRVGDHIEFAADKDRIRYYRVVAVIHPAPDHEDEPAPRDRACDVYAVDDGETGEVIARLLESASGGRDER